MADATPSRIGQSLGAGDTRALFLKLFSGQVLTVYDAACIMKDYTRIRNISSGKSAQFPAIGNTVAEYHTAGAELSGNVIQQSEKIISIDDLLVAHTFVSNIDEAMSHFEVRSEYAQRMGYALAATFDRNLLSLAVKAARDPAGIGKGAVGQGNAVSTNIGATPTAQDIIDAFYAAAQALDEKNIPDMGRVAIVPPSTFYALVTNDKILNRFFSSNNGDYSKAVVGEVAGIKIVKSNHVAVDHTAATATYPDYTNDTVGAYAVNAADTTALILHGDALGTVKLLELSSEAEWDIRRQGTLMVSKMAVGHGVLRPEGIYELRAAAP